MLSALSMLPPMSLGRVANSRPTTVFRIPFPPVPAVLNLLASLLRTAPILAVLARHHPIRLIWNPAHGAAAHLSMRRVGLRQAIRRDPLIPQFLLWTNISPYLLTL